MHIISHISKNLTQAECNLFIKAISAKGSEANSIIWVNYWFDYKNDKTNVIKPEYKSAIIEAINQNQNRLFKYQQKLIK